MSNRQFVRAAVVAATFLAAPVAYAQGSAADHIRIGDREHAAHNVASAYRHYEMAVAADSNSYEAEWKASRNAVEAGEVASGSEQRKLYAAAEKHARRAVKLNPSHAEGHVALARALGRTALSVGKRERVKYAGEVREQALEALKYDPRHAGALHIMGVWNAEIMRLSGVTRFMAKNFLGGQVFESASWKDAVRYMEQAVAVDPDRLVHRIDLAEIYADAGDKAKARAAYQHVVSARAVGPADTKYKQQAERALKAL
jgi:tetratricopeptide (TPR) repeat protein